MKFSSWLRLWADRLDPPRDHMMARARAYGLLFSETQTLPPQLARDRRYRARVVAHIDAQVVPDLHGGNAMELWRAFTIMHGLMPTHTGLTDEDLISVGLRLWSGALCGAKLVAYQTRSGVNDQVYRARQSAALLPTVRADKIFAAGVGCAVELKKLRGQQVSLDGVHPEVLRVLR